MNILLAAINAKYIHSNLAVYSLKSSAGEYSEKIDLAEFTINNQTEDIFRSIYQKKPDLLFFSCYIWNRSVVLDLAENIRKVMPDVVIWAGGPEVSYDAEQFLLENPQFDGVMIGEGEYTFYRLLRYYVDQEGSLAEISGITYYEKRGGEIRATGSARMLDTLDELPFVYQVPETFANRIIYYESSRGCPYSCSYCLSSIDKRVRFRSLELVKKELSVFLEHKVPQVKFVDRTFNCRHDHAMEIWRFLSEHDNGVTNFHFEIAADILTEEEIDLLSRMRPGLVQLEIGVQTVNEKTLGAINRSAKFEKIADRVKRISAAKNIHQHLDLIAGLPYEDYDSFKDSFDAVYALKPQELQLGFLKVLRGSQMHQEAEKYGILYRSQPPYEVLATKWISCDELLRLKEVEEMVEVYYNSQQFRYTIDALEKLFERPFALYEALADYYKGQMLEGKSFSRMQRFLILRDFVKMLAEKENMEKSNTEQHDAERVDTEKLDMRSVDTEKLDIEKFDELLVLDFYLRENGKSRPVWAEDLGKYHDEIVQFYQREEERHRYLQGYSGYTWKQTMRMTHLEHVFYDLLGDGSKKEKWLLFDYGKRNPLTNDAVVYVIDSLAMPGGRDGK
ncbi:MAG: B12-binding domain-containing radical SAM protein [Lachnospiraceae bacterium]|nr:B12-binding domain-containing radical SAM protein [Lachnospiraceae bacterium]